MDNLKQLVDLIINTIDQDITKDKDKKETRHKLVLSLCALTGIDYSEDYSEFDEKFDDLKSYQPSSDDPLSIAISSNIDSLLRMTEDDSEYSEFSLETLWIIKKILSNLPNIITENKIRERVMQKRVTDLKKARGVLSLTKEDEAAIMKSTYEDYDRWFHDEFSKMEEPRNMTFNSTKVIPESITEPFVKVDWYPIKDTFAITNTGRVYQWINFRCCQVPTRPVKRGGERVINLSPTLKVYVSHLVWEAYHPEYRGKEYSLSYLDNNPNNLSLDNLILKTGSELELK